MKISHATIFKMIRKLAHNCIIIKPCFQFKCWFSVWGHTSYWCLSSRPLLAMVLRWQSFVSSGELLRAACRCVTAVQGWPMKWRGCCLQPTTSAGHRWALISILFILWSFILSQISTDKRCLSNFRMIIFFIIRVIPLKWRIVWFHNNLIS